uniref:cytochrome c oxidase subunit II n=1 Tax=Metathelazia capsulata TaxID=2964486 RepID=UPI002E78A40C|nr:cytochrome c oxidase subunit II [Metathelazia capsulata]WPS93537.1 cytochrome c oxidase subunit II [Metathelazia capsulata]
MFFNGVFFPIPVSSYSFCCHYVHNHYMHIIFFVTFVVFFFYFFSHIGGHSFNFNYYRNDSRMIEYTLQFLVIGFLGLMIGPGFWLVQYQGRMFYQPDLSVKVIGHQWYWTYEYSDLDELSFDSFMKSVDDLDTGELRLLEVDNRCIIPMDFNLMFYFTSTDVIHSFSLPKCSIKMDALNGLLTNVSCFFPLIGVYYGQCSEICGANHSYMPISLEVTSFDCWKNWVMSFYN